MNIKFLGILAAAIIVIGGGALLFSGALSSSSPAITTPSDTTTDTGSTSQASTTPDTGSTGSSTGSTTAPASYTLAQVATHTDASSCWSAINGKVYDLTSWIGQHPGGPQRILSICGKDGSSAFNTQHSGQARPADELATFYIGALAQ